MGSTLHCWTPSPNSLTWVGRPRDAVTDYLGHADEVVTPQGGARLDPSSYDLDATLNTHCTWKNTSGYSSCPGREVVRIPDHLRNPGYTAFGGCIAHGGLRATAGEFYNFNRASFHTLHTLPPSLTHTDSLRSR